MSFAHSKQQTANSKAESNAGIGAECSAGFSARAGRLRRIAVIAAASLILLAASACASRDGCNECSDVVTNIPWAAQESHTYELRVNNDLRGSTTLAVETDAGVTTLTQKAIDDKGNSDDTLVVADAATLKPQGATHTVADDKQKRVADATYEDVDKDCSSKRVVRITQNTFEPPDESTPDSSRSNPLCVPDHSFDNDESLFLWRTIRFEKGYTATYHAIFSNRRDQQIVTVRVREQNKVKTPAGEFDAWIVDITADQASQTAWFATTDDHRLLAYQNENYFFRITQ